MLFLPLPDILPAMNYIVTLNYEENIGKGKPLVVAPFDFGLVLGITSPTIGVEANVDHYFLRYGSHGSKGKLFELIQKQKAKDSLAAIVAVKINLENETDPTKRSDAQYTLNVLTLMASWANQYPEAIWAISMNYGLGLQHSIQRIEATEVNKKLVVLKNAEHSFSSSIYFLNMTFQENKCIKERLKKCEDDLIKVKEALQALRSVV